MGEFRARDYAHLLHRGSGGSMYTRKAHATREAPLRDQDDQPDAREGQAGRSGVAARLVVPLKPDNAGGGKGLGSRQTQQAVRDREIGQPNNSETCSRSCDGVTRERRSRSRLSLLLPCTTRSAARIFWHMPMPSAAPTRAHRAWTARTLRTSKRMGVERLADLNWRLRSGRRHTDRSRSDACFIPRPTANSGRWASRPCGIGSA